MRAPRCSWISILAIATCSATNACGRTSEARPLAGEANPLAGERARERVVTFQGACDASGAVELDDRHFLVADDEDNVLRVYDAERGGRPLFEVDLSTELTEGENKAGESDFEAATRIGDRAYFVASHGRSSKGKRDPNRLVLLATGLPNPERPDTAALPLAGRPYRSLLDDMTGEPKLQHFKLHEAAERAPKEPGGLNLEGMTADVDGSLLLGFRNPLPEGRALLIRLLNPEEVVAGARARFSEPMLFDFDGMGVRALSSWRSSLLVIAGPSGDGGPFRLVRFEDWKALTSAASNPPRGEPLDIDLAGFGAEAFFTPDSRDEIMLLSDDGTRPIGGKPCKKLKDARSKSFRGVWVELPRR